MSWGIEFFHFSCIPDKGKPQKSTDILDCICGPTVPELHLLLAFQIANLVLTVIRVIILIVDMDLKWEARQFLAESL